MPERRAVYGEASGRVQGVFYRASLCREAQSRGLTGWVRNLPDGRVAFHIQGKAGAVDELIAWARVGPAAARVDRLETRERRLDHALRRFEIRR